MYIPSIQESVPEEQSMPILGMGGGDLEGPMEDLESIDIGGSLAEESGSGLPTPKMIKDRNKKKRKKKLAVSIINLELSWRTIFGLSVRTLLRSVKIKI